MSEKEFGLSVAEPKRRVFYSIVVKKQKKDNE
jgi:hypothetical protein